MIELYHHPLLALGCRNLMLAYTFGSALTVLGVFVGSLVYDQRVSRIYWRPTSRLVTGGAAMVSAAAILLVPLVFPAHFALFVGVTDKMLSTLTCHGYREDGRSILLSEIQSVRFDVAISESRHGTSYRPYFLIRYGAPSQDFRLDLDDISAPGSLTGLDRISRREADVYRKWLGL